MSAIEDAKAALAELQVDVTTLLARPASGVPEADVQQLATDMAALDAQVKQVLGT